VDVVAKGSTIDAISRAEACSADLIVSTLPLANPSTTTVVVSPLLTPDEIKHVQQVISRITSGESAPSQPYQPTVWAAELSQLLTGVKTAEDMHSIIEEYLEAKLAPRAAAPKVSLPFDQRLDPGLVAFVQHLADSVNTSLSPDRVIGLTLHLTFALDRWRQGQFIREEEAEHQRYCTAAPGAPEAVWKALVDLAKEHGVPSPPVDETIPVMRYLTVS
jgi:transcriptional regulatory protein LevR